MNKRSTILERYYDDQRWAYRHFPEWKDKYGNKWIAVRNHKIIAWGDNVIDVSDQIEKKAIKSKFASIMFVEKGAHVY